MEQDGTMRSPQEVAEKMLAHDAFSQLLGLELDEVRLGYCRLHFSARADMLNGFGRLHGGAVFSAADTAFAYACNSHGRLSMALDVSITFTGTAKPGEVLYVEARELHLSHRTGLYDIRTTNEAGELIALFKGTSYRTSKYW